MNIFPRVPPPPPLTLVSIMSQIGGFQFEKLTRDFVEKLLIMVGRKELEPPTQTRLPVLLSLSSLAKKLLCSGENKQKKEKNCHEKT